MLTYATIDGEVYDLSGLTPDHRAYFDRCYAAFRDGMAWAEFGKNLVYGSENPLLADTPMGMVTRAVYDHPLFQVIHDLDGRLAIQQHMMGLGIGDDVSRDPLDDEWVTVAEAERRKGVTHNALHYAIQKGRIFARPAKSGGAWLVVTVRSLERWTPSEARQRAGPVRRAAPA